MRVENFSESISVSLGKENVEEKSKAVGAPVYGLMSFAPVAAGVFAALSNKLIVSA